MSLARPPCNGGLPGSVLVLVTPLLSALEQSPRWSPLPCGSTSCCFSPSGRRVASGFTVVMGEQPVKDKRHPDGLSGKQIKQRTYKFKCGQHVYASFTHLLIVRFPRPATGWVWK